MNFEGCESIDSLKFSPAHIPNVHSVGPKNLQRDELMVISLSYGFCPSRRRIQKKKGKWGRLSMNLGVGKIFDPILMEVIGFRFGAEFEIRRKKKGIRMKQTPTFGSDLKIECLLWNSNNPKPYRIDPIRVSPNNQTQAVKAVFYLTVHIRLEQLLVSFKVLCPER
ncbi:hypothetical protein WN944_006577 [Citrus x changshan-huyou]|uniref:Uncharacterized protein n=1 Tax=Citrus x changshan-huyou TaxID=2935761 RepID=A0AAP0MLK8_9ROSI